MAVKTICQTPGAVFHTTINKKTVSCTVDLPTPLNLTESQAQLLDSNIHNAMELVLAPYFTEQKTKNR